MPLHGNLKDMSLATLVQVNCQEMRSARLTLDLQGQKGEVYLSDGQVVHAELDRSGVVVAGEEALFQMLAWDNGTFALETETHSPEKTINRPWPELLLEGMKRVAEYSSYESRTEAVMPLTPISKLRAIEGVAGAVIASSDGVVLAADMPTGDGEKEAAVAIFVGTAAQQIGTLMGLGNLTQVVVTMKGQRVLVLPQPDRYLGLWLGENVSPAIVGNSAVQVLAASRA